MILNTVLDVVVVLLLLNGCLFFLLGTVGVLRMPDVLTRLHPATKCDTLGGGSILLAMAIYSLRTDDALRLVIIGVFLFVSSATCGHAIGRSVVRNNPKCLPENPAKNVKRKKI